MAQIQTRKRADGTATYRVGYRHDHGDGRKLHWTGAFTTADAAVEAKGLFDRHGPELALATLATRTGRNIETGPPLLAEWFETHLENLASHATPGTVAWNRAHAARSWLPRLGPLPLDAIERDHVTAWVAAQRGTETARSVKVRTAALAAGLEPPAPRMWSVTSITSAHGILSSVLSAAVEADHIAKNVARGVKMPSDEESAGREKDIFTEEEWQRFIGSFQEHYLPVVHFMIETGVRIGEASAVQVRDLELGSEHPWVHVRRAWKKGARATERYLGAPKSKRSNRTIMISRTLAGMIAPLVQGKDADELVFTAVRGGRIHPGRFNQQQWKTAMRLAGITKHLTPHSLRHTSASWLLMAGVSPLVVQHRLGHESISTTSEVYAHLLIDAQFSAVAATERALGHVVAPTLEIEESPEGTSPA